MGPPKTTGCRPTIIRNIPSRASRTAPRPPISDCRCSPTCPPTISATSAPAQLIERTASTFHTLHTMERHLGHFYNWYDTQTLKPLAAALHLHRRQRQPRRPPVDAAAGLLALPDQKIVRPACSTASTTRSWWRRIPTTAPCRPNSPPWKTNSHRRPKATRPLPCPPSATCCNAWSGGHRTVKAPSLRYRRWARVLAGQCQNALNDIGSACREGLQESHTLRELRRCTAPAPGQASPGNAGPAEHLAANAAASPTSSTTSSSTTPAAC